MRKFLIVLALLGSIAGCASPGMYNSSSHNSEQGWYQEGTWDQGAYAP